MAKNGNIMTELMQKYGVSSGSYGGGTERTVSQSFGVSGGASGGNDLMQNLMNKYFGEDAQPEHERKQKLVSDWQKRYDTATKGFSRYENSRNGGYTRDAGGGYAAEIDALIRDFDSIKDFAGSYGMAGAKRYLYYLQDIQEYISDTNAAMSQFQDEEEYNRYLRGQDGGSTDISSLEQEIQDLKSFIDQSEYDMTDTNQRKKASQDVDRLNDLEDRYTFARYQDMISGLSDKDRKALEDSHGKDSSMAYGYLLQKGYSREDINAMYETMKREKTAELSDDALRSVYDWTGKNAGTAAAGFAGARAGNLAGAVTGTFQTINDTARHYLQGSPYHGTDPNAAGYLPSRMAGAADQAVSDAIEGENGGILRKGAAFVYRGAANAADNLARMAVSSAIGGPALGMSVNSAFAFTQGFQSSYREAQEKGGSPIQGMLVGSVDGGMEVFTESRTFERLMNLKDPELIGEGVYEWLKTAAVGVGNEITEEEASYIANTIADAVIMADKSESAEFIKSKVEEGKTPAQARWELVKKYAHEMAVTAADTAISTLLMDGVTGAVANYQYKKTYGGSAAELVQEGLESPEGTQSRTLAEKYQKKLDSGKTLSGAELQMLVNANEIQIAAEENAASEQENEEQPSFQNPTPEAETGTEESFTPKPTLESLSEKYGAYAGAMQGNYLEGQDVEEYDRAFQTAYDMGKSGLNKDALSRVEALSVLKESQKEIAYEIGQTASAAEAKAQSAKNADASNGKTLWHKGVVRGDGVKIADLTRTFNDPQRKAYSALSTIAEATGIDIVLYKSQANEDGEFQGEQGRFSWSDNTIYIDINAGLNGEKDVGSLAKYTMLRTYGHEFTHFIEKWNPEQYNDFRKAVFETMENPEDLIETRLAQDSTGKMSYDDASREVVAEAMTDILEDSQFLQKLAERNKSVFQMLKDKLKEFVSNLKSYFQSLAKNGSREANLLKKEVGDSISYLEGIVKQFDEIAVQAVENYQRTVAEDATVSKEEKVVSKTEKTTPSKKEPQPDKNADEAQKEAEREKPVKEPEIVNEPVNEGPADVYGELKNTLMVVNLYRANGYDFRVTLIPGAGYNGTIVRSRYSDSYVSNARDRLFDRMFTERIDAVEYMVDIARNNKMLETATDSAQSETKPKETVTKQEAETTSYDGFSITTNTERGTLEIRFDRKPNEETRSGLKERGFRWSSKNKLWYGNGDQQQIAKGIENAMSGIGFVSGEEIRENLKETEIRADQMLKKAEEVYRKSEYSDQSETNPKETVTQTPSEKLADHIVSEYLSQKKPLTSKELYAMADTAFGGTQAEGAYNRKDAYDAMELAVNKHLLTAARAFNGDQKTAVDAVKYMQSLLELLPTQSVRTQEQQDFQQFSTPPNIAYLAAWAANINAQDSVLEPSAGIGGLAVFAKAWGAEVAVNELSKRRLEVLRAMGFDHMFNENAEQIDNILPENISPSVVIMNPPFSSTAGRTKNNKTSNAEKHIDQALMRLRDGGRLVAILGKGMNDADYYKYWDKLRKTYRIRANLSIDGNNYKKYGTTWGVQIVVIDKTGPQTGETLTGSYTDLTEVPRVLEGIRNDRSNVEKGSPASDGNRVDKSVAYGGNSGNSDAGHSGSSERASGSAAQSQRKKNRKVADAAQGTAGRTNGKTATETGSEAAGSQDGRTDRTDGRTDSGDSTHADGSGTSNQHEPELPQQGLTEQEEASDDGVYATFVLPDIPVKGSRKHPAVLVESAAMAAVSMPKATYVPKLPADVVKNNLSDAQMVTVTYAGQAHEQKLPDGRRRGFFIGDGTGVGKGRQIAGIILDNFMQGRDKAVWISKNDDLYGDAVRDWTQTTGRSKDEVVSQGKFKPKDSITMKSGILFTSYGKLKMEKGGNRLDQIVQWVGKDFDGVIAFDEAHFMGNLFGKNGKFGKSKGSLTAKAGVELQRQLPNARILYVSATAATEVDNLAYAERLGLWGQGTAFNNAQDFIAKIGSSGLAAMELVIRDMKAMGSYVARSISYNGVNYDTVEHSLDPMQVQIYDTMSRAWQKTMSNVQSALTTTGGKYNSAERQRALGNFYSSMQRFYNQVLTSMAMPSVIADMRKELAAGHSCVLQIVNTNEAQQNKQLAEAKANGESLDNLDMTPREALIGYLNTSFPTQLFEEYTDDDGNLRSRPVLDSKGNPVQSKEAVRQRDALIAEVNQMSIPDGPLEMLFDAFGTEAVAENTGRSRRVVPKKQEDGSITRVEERRSLNHRTADVQAFQDGKKRILVFSDAGGTGKSYHADRSEKNQQLRIHYVLQPGWVASNAVQGFGRTHRSNEVTPPVYKLVTTNIKGQKRFTSTIARRLDQLGALTKGQRDTGSGMFGAKDNLETDLAKDSLREFYKRLGKNQIEGIDGMKTLDRLGLKQKFTDEYGAFKLNDTVARDISTFLNRILSLEVEEQNTVFDAFISIYEMELEAAIQAGTLDTGMENVKADKIEIVDDKVIREDSNSGAATHYIQAKTYTKPKIVTTVAEMSTLRSGFEGLYKTESGAVKAVFRIADKTTEWGAIQKQYRLVGPNQGAKNSVWGESTLKNKAKAIEKADWQKEWDAEIAKVPEYNEDTLHMLTGALLPIWNSLPQEGSTKVKRLIAEDGSVYLGRVISKDMIDGVLRSFAIGRTMEVFTGKQVMDKAIQNGVRFQLTNDRVQIYRSRVSNEWRLEVYQPYNSWYLTKRYPGIIQERISYRDRFFIPVGENGIAILDKMLKDNPVRSTMEDAEQFQQRTNTLTDREILSMAADKILASDAISMDAAESDALGIFKKRLDALDRLQEQRRELGKTYRELQFGESVDREKAAETLKQMRSMDQKIQEAENKVIAAETAPALRKILPVARRIVEQKQKEQDDAVLQRWRDRRNNAAAIKKYRERISKDVTDLGNWILSPSNKTDMKHVPDVLKNTVIEFLNSIDFTSKRKLNGGEATKADTAFVNRLVALQSALDKNAEDTGLYSGYNDLPPWFHDKLKAFIASAQAIVNAKSGQSVINQMTSQELKSLSDIVKALKKLIKDFNRFHANAVYQHVYDAGDATIRELNEYEDAKSRTKADEGIYKFVLWNQIRPAYAFERFGNGGKAIYDGLRRGQSQLAFDTKEIVAFSEKAYTEKEVTDWDKEVKTIQLEDGTVKMRVSQIMSFYELLKREQAKGHIFGQGIRVSTFLANGKKVSDTGHTISIEDANRIVAELTPRQKDVADALQKYMQEKGGSWGNYVSVKRFGEKLFGEENYFPINSDGRHIEAVADEKMEGQSLYALLNMGFTKKLQEKANNRIVVYSIFDVFSNHMASMAQYHAMALPVLDALKWFNYQQKEMVTVNENGKELVHNQVVDSVRDQLNRVYGVPEETKPGAGRRGYAENFIIGILKAFNGTETQGISSDEIGLNALRRFNMAQVAYNFRVVIQQPMAVTRAAMVIDYASIIRGLRLSPKVIQKNIEEMNQYSGIAAWKDLGFYDTNISRGLTDIIKHKKTGMEKFREAGMWGAEKADQLTWAAMWSACKEEVQRKHGILPGNEHFYEAVSSLFEEVVYKTQVVDSVLTKNEYLRSKGLFARATGSFMSEPTATASMVVDAFDKYRMDLQKKGGNHRDAWRKNGKRIGRTLYVYSLGAVVLAAVQAVADAFRDDDEYEEYGEKWMEAFIGNVIDELNPFNKLPLVTEFCDLAKKLLSVVGVDTYGYAPTSIWLQWADDLVKGTQILYQKIFGEGNNYTWYGGISKLLKAASGMSGAPMAALTREVITGWNSIIKYMAPDLVVKDYDPGDKSTIKYAYLDGYLTKEEAYQELLSKGISEDEDEAYWTVQKWDGGDDYSKYDEINKSVRNGEDITKQMAELTSHGHTEEQVVSNIKSSIGKWYQEGEITGQKAVDMFVRYGGLSRQEATEKVYTWDFIKKHPECEGISYSAIENYETFCEKTGMSAKVFYDAWKYNYSAKSDVDASGKAISGSKKEKVLRYINGLNLSYAQKDGLYYAFGWSQSTINEAPWH